MRMKQFSKTTCYCSTKC